jgi:hypothetical protein
LSLGIFIPYLPKILVAGVVIVAVLVALLDGENLNFGAAVGVFLNCVEFPTDDGVALGAGFAMVMFGPGLAL